ncbi:piggyBac transposable element-derived protein 3-like [Cydia splendana]|uniref:piggyBac transposable element-derived protein 3-like n=1 Tax=Cydia splendana TaxID=1100963 RepID=UPI00300C69AF
MPTPPAPEYSPHPTPLPRATNNRNRRKKSVPKITAINNRNKRKKSLPKVTAKKVKKTRLVLNLKWLKTTLKNRGFIDENLYKAPNVRLETALNYLYLFLTPDIIEDIVHNTNLYSVQQTGKSIQFSNGELKKFLGIEILMGIIKMPAYTDYWARKTRYPLIADEMPLKRYQQIRRNIHFVDNSFQNTDRYFKIRPVMEKIRLNFLKLEEEGEYSIDEMMIPYKGTKAGNRRQYIQNKPKKWGFKNFVRAGVSGLIYDFIMYGGDDTFRGYTFTDAEESIGIGGKVVISLCKSIQTKPAVIFADNFFTYPELVYILRNEYGIFSLGTIRNNRLRGCQDLLPSDKEMKKKPRGNSAQIVCNQNNLAVVKWSDNKVVTFISSYMDSHPIETIKRYSKDKRAKIDVPCPQVVKQYNKHMGGVDLADMFISLYRIPFKSRRWYLGIFSQLIDMCINNAWILYRKEHGQNKTPLKKFRLEIYEGLCKFNRTVIDENGENISKKHIIQKPVIERPTDCIRYDNVGHFPEIGEKTMRCRFCKDGRTTIYCIKCNMPLCIVAGERKKRNCFRQFHTK